MAMKRLKEVEGDKLTNLPINVQHLIQERLPMEEAARMSVLSRPWRHVWASIPRLDFFTLFCQTKPPSDTLIDVIRTILLQHDGPIKTLLLNISSIPSSQHSVINQWMLFLSRNGIMDLKLHNLHNAPYKLPSYVYGVVELKGLRLSNCIFRPPCSFRGFHLLKTLKLFKVILDLDDATSFLWMPNLVTLSVRLCSGFPNAKIYAPNLCDIDIRGAETPDLGHFMDCRKLKLVILTSSSSNQEKIINLTYLLNCWPEVRIFALDSYYFKSFATEVERLTTCLNSLRSLALVTFDFDDEDQIFSLLGMLRSSPNLDDLAFVSWKKKGSMEVDANHFEGPLYRTLGLHKLQRLRMGNFRGSRAEMLFVRFILASAPLLLKTILNESKSVHESQSLKISKELLGFPRASPKLEIYVNHQK